MTKDEAIAKLSADLGNVVVCETSPTGAPISLRDSIAQCYYMTAYQTLTSSVIRADAILLMLATSVLSTDYLRLATEDEIAVASAVAPNDDPQPVNDWRKRMGL